MSETTWVFTLLKDGQVIEVEAPKGLSELNSALSAISYLQPYDLISQDTKQTNQGWFR